MAPGPGGPGALGPGAGGLGLPDGGPYGAAASQTVSTSQLIAALPQPPDDLADVLKELAKFGIKSPRLAAQTMVNGTTGREFRMQGSLSNPIGATMSVEGMVTAGSGDLQSQLNIFVSKSTGGRSGDRPVCNLSTNIAVPAGHFVVLGVTPTDDMTSIFVVQITPAAPSASAPIIDPNKIFTPINPLKPTPRR